MASINVMVQRVSGMLDTHDLSDWEDGFVRSLVRISNDGKDTTRITEKQIEVLERIFNKHFSG
jgi:hypothetical protein